MYSNILGNYLLLTDDKTTFKTEKKTRFSKYIIEVSLKNLFVNSFPNSSL